MKYVTLVLVPVYLAACAPVPEQTPVQKHLNRVAGAEIAARQCPSYGGYGSVAEMRADAARNWQQAQALGATEADLATARDLVQSQYANGVFLVGPAETCRQFINTLAWAGSAPIS